MNTIVTNLEGYLNWLAGADHDLTDDQIVDLRKTLFSAEADEIQAIAATALGAGA